MSEPQAAYATNTGLHAEELAAQLQEEQGHTHAWYVTSDDHGVPYAFCGVTECMESLDDVEIAAVLNRTVQPKYSGFGRMETWQGERLER